MIIIMYNYNYKNTRDLSFEINCNLLQQNEHTVELIQLHDTCLFQRIKCSEPRSSLDEQLKVYPNILFKFIPKKLAAKIEKGVEICGPKSFCVLTTDNPCALGAWPLES